MDIIIGEAKKPRYVTYLQLYRSVSTLATALRKCGVKKGDCVAGYLPNDELAVVAMLASASIGAIWSSTSPDFGVSVSGFATCEKEN